MALTMMMGLVAQTSLGEQALPPAAADTATSNNGGSYTVSSTVSPATVPAGGGNVTVTYSLENTSGGALWYYSDRNSLCTTTVTGMTESTYYPGDYYLQPGQTATMTCSGYVAQTQDITASFAMQRPSGAIERATLTDTVTAGTAAAGTCDVPWYSSFLQDGTDTSYIGQVDPATGATTQVQDIPEMMSGYFYSPSMNTYLPGYLTGSSGMAIDPTNPNFAYFSGRMRQDYGNFGQGLIPVYPNPAGAGYVYYTDPNTGGVIDQVTAERSGITPTYYDATPYSSEDIFTDELYRMDLSTGTMYSVGYATTGAYATNRMSIDANGTLWTIALDGTMYSIDNVNGLTGQDTANSYDPTVLDAQTVAHGTPATAAGLDFSTLTSGDIAFDGTGTMWVLASDGTNANTTNLLTIGASELAKTSGVRATMVGEMGVPATVAGPGVYFNGLAFASDGTLYASSVEDRGTGYTYPYKTSGFYTIDKATGAPTLVGTSQTNGGTGDLGSCALPAPKLQISKTATPDSTLPGGTITYTITMENVGGLPASGATFIDNAMTGSDYVAGSTQLNGTAVPDVAGAMPYTTTRPVNGSTTSFSGVIPEGDKATVTYQVTTQPGQTEVCNQGEASYVSYPNGVLSDDPNKIGTDDKTCVPVADPKVQIVKKINGDDANTAPGVEVPVGQPMNVTFEVTNTGNSPLANVTVTDAATAPSVAVSNIVCPNVDATDDNVIAGLMPGRTVTCTGTVAAPAAGTQHTNTATVTGVPGTANNDGTVTPTPDATPVTDEDPANAHTADQPGWNVAKSTTDGPVAITGSAPQDVTRNYTVTVTNTGTAAAAAPVVTDTPSVPNGFAIKSVTVDGTAVTVAADGTFEIPGGQQVDGGAAATHQVVVTYTVTPVAITAADWTALGQCTTTGGNATSGPGAGLYNVVSLPDGTPDGDGADNNDVCTNVTGTPAIEIVKSINDDDAHTAPGVAVTVGSTMNITFDVTNTGSQPLSNVTVTDDQVAASSIVCAPATNNVVASLAPGASVQCTATLAAPAAGVQHTNTGTVVGTPPPGPDGTTPPPVTDDDPGNAHVPSTPGVAIVKSINGDDANTAPGVSVAAGSDMAVSFLVTNTGNQALTNVTVTDDMVAASAIDCAASGSNVVATLAVGEAVTCTATLPAPAAGVQHTNVGTVTATPPNNPDGSTPPAVTDEDPANAIVPAVPAVQIVKKINGDDANTAPGVSVTAGQPMSITYEVTNTGDQPLVNLAVTDDKVAASAITCPVTELAPGASTTCTATFTAPAAGVQHTNVGTVTGVPATLNPDGTYTPVDGATPVTDDDPANALPVASPVPAVQIVKTINGDDANTVPGVAVAAGSDMDIVFTVTNVGQTPLTDVTVTDDTVAASAIVCAPATNNVVPALAVGEVVRCTATLPAPAAGVQHTNVGTVVGTPPEDNNPDTPPTVTDDDPGNAHVPGTPSVQIIKKINGDDANTAPGVSVAVGSMMDITYDVTNTGNQPLTGLVVSDDKVSTISCPQTTLAVGETIQCTATLAAPAAGVQHTNVGTVVGTTPDDGDPNTPPVTVTDEDPANAITPAFAVSKVVADGQASPVTLDPAATTAEVAYTVTVTNNGATEATSNQVVDIPAQHDGFTVTKVTVDGTDAVAGANAGEYVITNGATVAAGASQSYRVVVTYAIDQQAITAGAWTAFGTCDDGTADNAGDPTKGLYNKVVMTGDSDPQGEGNNDACVPVTKPGLTIVKYINGADANTAPGVEVEPGSTMNVSYLVTNSGTSALTGVTVTDQVLSPSGVTVSGITADDLKWNVASQATSAFDGSLAPGEAVIFRGTAPAPAAGEQHTNEAVAKGTPPPTTPGGETPPPVESPKDPGNAWTPSLSIVKKLNGTEAHTDATKLDIKPGETVTATFEVTNTSKGELVNIKVADQVTTGPATMGAITCATSGSDTIAVLAAGASDTCTTTFTMPTGKHVDEATATVPPTTPPGTPPTTPPGVPPVTPPGEVPPVVTPPSEGHADNAVFGVAKSTSTSQVTLAKDAKTATASYTVTVSNLGTTDGTSGAVADVPSAPAGFTIASVTVDGTAVQAVNGAYPVTAGDKIAAGGAPVVHTVVVTYDVDQTKIVLDNPAAGQTTWAQLGTCSTAEGLDANDPTTVGDKTLGLHNQVTMVDDADGDTTTQVVPEANNDACIPVTGEGDFKVSKTTSEGTVTLAAGQDSVERTYTVTVTNTGSAQDTSAAVIDTPSLPTGFTVSKVVVDGNTLDDATVPFQVTAGDELAAGASKEHTVVVTYAVDQSKITPAVATQLATCSTDATNPVKSQGLFNDVTMAGDNDGYENNHVCTPVTKPGLTIVKYINGNDANTAPGVQVAPGSTMAITYLVTNTGTSPLDGIKVVDQVLSPSGVTVDGITADDVKWNVASKAVSDFTGSLAPGEAVLFRGTAPAPAAEVQHTNEAVAQGTPPSDGGVTPPPVESPKDPGNAWTPSLSIVKKLNGVEAHTDETAVTPKVGDKVTATFEVTNTSKGTLTDIKVTDKVTTGPATMSAVTCEGSTKDVIASLEAGATATCTATFTMPNGKHVDEATATVPPTTPPGTPPVTPPGVPPVTPPGEVPPVETPPSEGHALVPQLKVVKYINGDDANSTPGVQVEPGKPMTVTYLVTNTGQVPLDGVTVVDQVLSPSGVTVDGITADEVKWNVSTDEVSDFTGSLAPGEAVLFRGTAPAPKAGVQHTNEAVAKGTPPPSTPGGETPPPVESPKDPGNAWTPSLSIVKKLNGTEAHTDDTSLAIKAGDEVTATFEVTNTSVGDLVNVKVSDKVTEGPATMGEITCETSGADVIALLRKGETQVCSATFTMPTGKHVDEATAIVPPTTPPGTPPTTPPGVPPVTPPPAVPEVPSTPSEGHAHNPGFKVMKETVSDRIDLAEGQTSVTIDYTITVTNDGQKDGTSPEVTDLPEVPEGVAVTKVVIDGTVVEGDGSYLVTKGDALAAGESKTHTVAMTYSIASEDELDWEALQQCEVSIDGTNRSALVNLVEMGGDSDGVENNHACVPLMPPTDPEPSPKPSEPAKPGTPVPGKPEAPRGPGGVLSRTGSEVSPVLLAAGALSALAGLGLVVTGRRRRK